MPLSHFLKIHLNIILPSTPGSPKYLLHNVLIIAPTCSGLTSWPSSRLPEATAYDLRPKHAAAITNNKIAPSCKFYCSYKKSAFVNTWHERLLTALAAIRRRERQFRDQWQCGYKHTSTSVENEDGKLHKSRQEHDLTDHTHVKSTDSEPRGKRTDQSVLTTRRFNPAEERNTAVQRQTAKWQKSYLGHRIFKGQFWLFVYAAAFRMPNNSTDSLLYGCPLYRVPENGCFIAQTADIRRHMPCSRTHRMDTLYITPGADKSLARPGRKQAPKHARDARDFNNIETRAII